MSQTCVKTYRLGGRVYEQRPLVLGQIRQLEELLQDIPWETTAGAADLLRLLGDKLPLAAAVVLRPKRPWPLCLLYEPRRKNIRRLAGRLAYDLDLAAGYQVVADFFVCNPVRSFLLRLTGVLQETGAMPPATASPSSAPCSPAATSPGATPCSGDAPRPTADPTCDTGSGTSSCARPSFLASG